MSKLLQPTNRRDAIYRDSTRCARSGFWINWLAGAIDRVSTQVAFFPRSHAPRGNAVLDALRPVYTRR